MIDSRDPGDDLIRHVLKATAVVMLVVGVVCLFVGNVGGVVAFAAAVGCWVAARLTR